jgi:hypothetical protein
MALVACCPGIFVVVLFRSLAPYWPQVNASARKIRGVIFVRVTWLLGLARSHWRFKPVTWPRFFGARCSYGEINAVLLRIFCSSKLLVCEWTTRSCSYSHYTANTSCKQYRCKVAQNVSNFRCIVAIDKKDLYKDQHWYCNCYIKFCA